MNLRHLKHIVALADTLNFSQAAILVHLGQSAFSKSIAAFEEKIGLQIFERSTNYVTITPVGEVIVAHARQLLSEIERFSQKIEGLRTGEQGTINIGSGPYPARLYLHEIVRQFHQRYPKVNLQVRIDYWKNLLHLLRHNELDYFIADIRSLVIEEGIQITPLGGITVGFYCDVKHPLVFPQKATRPINPRDLLVYPLACVSLSPIVLTEIKQDIGLNPDDILKVNVQCDDISFAKQLAPGSDLILLTSNQYMQNSQVRDQFVKLNIPMQRNRYGEWALVQIQDRRLTPAAEQLAQEIIHTIRIGSLQDEASYGLKGNNKFNFIAP